MSPHDQLILEALALRAWALPSLASPPASPPPLASAPGWALFLNREACAARLRRAAGDHAPPPLRDAADQETQLALLLRAELEEVMEVARSVGVQPVILKGGATLHTPGLAMGAKDLDLLLPEVEALKLVTALDANGWRPVRGGTGHHFAERVRPGAPPVEVHVAERLHDAGLGPDALAAAIPHPSLPGGRLLAPPDAVRYLAYHQTIQHSSHRGRLRDLLLLSDLLPETKGAPEPGRWGWPALQTTALRDVLAMADALRPGRSIQDRFETTAVAWYSMDLAAHGREEHPLRGAYAAWVFDLLAGDGSARIRWDRAWRDRLDDSGWGTAEASRSMAPGAFRRLARACWLPPLLMLAWIRARRERARAGRLRLQRESLTKDAR